MGGEGSLRSRLARLRKRRKPVDTRYADEHREMWVEEQRERAVRALELKRSRETSEATLEGSETGGELLATIVSYGTPEEIPEELTDRLEDRVNRLVLVPEGHRERILEILAQATVLSLDRLQELEREETDG